MSKDITAKLTDSTVSVDPVPEMLKEYNFLHRYAMKVSGNYETARDLVQDAFVKLMEKRAALSNDNIKAWMCLSIHNAFISQCRHNKAGRRYEKAAKGLLQIDEEAISIPDFERDEISHLITGVVEALPDHYRDTFKLCAEGLTYEQIAEKQQIPIGTVMSRMYRIRTELQSRLPQYSKAV
jgi:RNA polymerase sigma-70 factor (ECF subfamily)